MICLFRETEKKAIWRVLHVSLLWLSSTALLYHRHCPKTTNFFLSSLQGIFCRARDLSGISRVGTMGSSCSLGKPIRTLDSLHIDKGYCQWYNKKRVILSRWRRALLIDPLHPNISMQILLTVLCIYPIVLSRGIDLSIKGSYTYWSFSLFS